MTFECGKGGDGKGREFVFEKALFGHSFGSLDCAVFLDRSEWRRSAQFAWNKRCIRIQEFDSVSRVLAEIRGAIIAGCSCATTVVRVYLRRLLVYCHCQGLAVSFRQAAHFRGVIALTCRA